MVRSQLRRAVAILVLTSLLSLIPGSAGAAARRPHGDHDRAVPAKPRVESRRSPGVWSLALFFLEKMGVQIDPNGITFSPTLDGPH